MPDPRDQADIYFICILPYFKNLYKCFLGFVLFVVRTGGFMFFNKNIYQKDKLLGMLDLLIDYFIENNNCDFCLVKDEQGDFCIKGSDLCKSFIFEGLLKTVERGQRKNVYK